MNERDTFLDALKADPLDYTTRLVFSDWLEDHDEPELADWHRAQTPQRIREAEHWIRDLCERHLVGYGDKGEPILYDDLIASVRGGHYTQRGGQSLQDEGCEREFLRQWAIVTDTPMSDSEIDDSDYSFGCSC